MPTAREMLVQMERTFEQSLRLPPMRAWGADQKVPVPVTVHELLEGLEYDQFERELAEHLEGLSG